MSRILAGALALSVLVCFSCISAVLAQEQAEPLHSIDEFVSYEQLPGWDAVTAQELAPYLSGRRNTSVPALGIKRDVAGLFLFTYPENAEIIPVISLTMHPGQTLGIGEEAREWLEGNLDRIYSDTSGTDFRSFIIEEGRVAGNRAYKIIGVYRWRTNNVKIEQYLIPGGDSIFVLTYTNLEKVFSNYYPDFTAFKESLQVSATALHFDWLETIFSGLLTMTVAFLALFVVYFLYSIRPGGGGSSFSMFSKKDDDSTGNPFLRK